MAPSDITDVQFLIRLAPGLGSTSFLQVPVVPVRRCATSGLETLGS
jgi:hypothetical protein